jgi:uroporphyrin-III C-methyltransferase/precorrin-2 dehydrogenase/sirohydrochlorin ferrochelatase
MNHFPLFFNLQGKQALILGGDVRAWRKAKALLRAGLRVQVLADQLTPELRQAAERGDVQRVTTDFSQHTLDGVDYLLITTLAAELRAQAYQFARQRRIPVNLSGDPKRSDFVLPDMIEQGGIRLALSSGLRLPGLLRRVKSQLQSFGHRSQQAQFHPASSLATAKLASGEVALVGSGPGDVGLLTLNALQLIQTADVVVYDRLVSREIQDLIPAQTLTISVGKVASNHSVPQSQINQILVEQAQAGRRVVRLKGGDSFIFGRGGEELQELIEAQIKFSVTPGITAASGCTTYAGIPLTHRDYAQAVTFVTGHCKANGQQPDWAALAASNHTLVVYMGRAQAQTISDALMRHGLNANTPVAIIENGTREEQQVYRGRLNQLGELAEPAGSPALVVIGDVVSLADQLAWFHPKYDTPLFEQQIA